MILSSGVRAREYAFCWTAFRARTKLASRHEKPGLHLWTFPSVRVREAQATQLAPLVLCALDDGSGTLVGVLKNYIS